MFSLFSLPNSFYPGRKHENRSYDWVRNEFLRWNTIQKSEKEKNKLDFMKIKSLCAAIYQIINDVKT